jgi:hypothetical protein
MGAYRLDQTATRLADGRVLVTGGQGDEGALKSTEIYNPNEDRWISAAPMDARRYGHAATLLPDGDVLVLGGSGDVSNSQPTSAEFYDPRTNLWVTGASMAAAHLGHTATLLGNGTVLVIGSPANSRPELYDLAGNRWSETGPAMNRYRHTATLLRNGQVLIVGSDALDSLDSVLAYDPNGMAPAAPLELRTIAQALLIGVLLLGGLALFIPAVRKRLRSWRRGPPEEWIT